MLDGPSRIRDAPLPMDLNALRSFLAVVAHGGLAPASRKLRIPKSTLSRHVILLEDELGVRLLERGARGFRVTAEGESLAERGSRALAEIDEAERGLRAIDAPPRGPLRVAVPNVFAHLYLGQLAAAFHAKYPEVLLEAIVPDTIGDIVAEGIDVAIALDVPTRAELVVRRLATEPLVMVAPPALLKARKKARTPLDAPWPAVVPGRPQAQGERFAAATASRTWTLVDGPRKLQIIARPVIRLPSKLAIRDAVLAGAGVALLGSALVDGPISTGALTRIGVSEERHTMCIVHASSRLVTSRVRAFVDFVVDAYPELGLRARRDAASVRD